jgi:16S rRNA C967 or C1407 C5-methylase (RsmB/RsmF family)
MGQRGGRKNGNNKRSRENDSKDERQPRPYNSNFPERGEIDNALFTEYYRGNIVPEDQWEPMAASMREQLPIAFRVSNITGPQKQILGLLNGNCFGLPKTPTEFTSEDGTTKVTLSRPSVLPFYRPKGNAFQMELGRRELKRFTQIEKFREFLILHNHVGNITRQEAVSMIPPLLLDVKPHHVVLDMCAAPGSKTSQLLEALHQGLSPGEIPTGIIIANDANPDRAYMLVHQLKRLGSPSFMVTTHEGQTFPSLFIPETSSIASNIAGFREGTFQTYQDKVNSYFTTGVVPQVDEITGEQLKTPLAPVLFDRILCDVPCGGDGTMRKTPTVWSNWQLSNSFALHPLQLMISWRALQLLKIGGLMVYSTCSINPIEDEAVVMELIRRSKGTLELVNIPQILPELNHLPGRTQWKDYAEIPKQGETPAHLVHLTSLKDILDLPSRVLHKIRPTELSPALLEKIYPEAELYAKEQVQKWEAFVAETKAKFPTIEEAKADVTKKRLEAKAAETEIAPPKSEDQAQTKKKFQKKENKREFKDQHVVNSFVRELLRMKYRGSIETISNTTRVLPHQQNTGGFYIALIRKVAQLPSLDESLVPIPSVYTMRYDMFNDVYSYSPEEHAVPIAGEDILDASRITNKKINAEKAALAQEQEQVENTLSTAVVPSTTTDDKKQQQQQLAKWNKDPFIPSQQKLYDCLAKVWGVKTTLSLLARNASKHYLMSKAVQELILCPQNYRLKVVHGGLKAFEQDNFLSTVYNKDNVSTDIPLEYPADSYFRVCQDGAQYMAQYVTHQKIAITKEDMILLLSQAESTNINEFSPDVKAALLNTNNRLETDLSKVIRAGSCLFTYTDEPNNISIVVAGLKRAYSVSLLVEPVERSAYKYLLGVSLTVDASVPTTEETEVDPTEMVLL